MVYEIFAEKVLSRHLLLLVLSVQCEFVFIQENLAHLNKIEILLVD